MSRSPFLVLDFLRVGFWLISGGFNFNWVVMLGLGIGECSGFVDYGC